MATRDRSRSRPCGVAGRFGACGKKAPETPDAKPGGGRCGDGGDQQEIVEDLRQRSYDASETVPGVVVNLPDVYLFAFGSSTIEAEGRAKLKELAAYLSRPELASRRVSIEGHTDSVGTDAFNQGLSERRAQSVQAGAADRRSADGTHRGARLRGVPAGGAQHDARRRRRSRGAGAQPPRGDRDSRTGAEPGADAGALSAPFSCTTTRTRAGTATPSRRAGS